VGVAVLIISGTLEWTLKTWDALSRFYRLFFPAANLLLQTTPIASSG
jgi:hypothetical protein